MRVVFDTNILISACWSPGGNEARVLALAKSGRLEIAVSATIAAEYREVAQRPKFAKHRDALDGAIAAILEIAVTVEPVQLCEACSDPDDNQLLDCALAAQAQYLITGNLRHFPEEWRGVRVINARTLLDDSALSHSP